MNTHVSKLLLSMNLDEVADNFSDALEFVVENNVEFVELRTINGKNLALMSLEETEFVANAIRTNGKTVSAIASPLFKWYTNKNVDVSYDSFGFDPNLNFQAKKHIIKHVIKQAQIFEAKRVRIFSGLRESANDNIISKEDLVLLVYALKLAQEARIFLLLENEPACKIATFKDYLQTLFDFKDRGLMAWVDIANFYEIGEAVSQDMMQQLSKFTEYIHIKDPVGIQQHKYVPVGEGYINYKKNVPNLLDALYKETFYSIETHVKDRKTEASEISIKNFRTILYTPRLGYAVIGAGRISLKHAAALKSSHTSTLVGVYDTDKNKAKKFTQQNDCMQYQSFKDVLADKSVSVINICTPHDLHIDLAEQCLKAGKVVLCEKPFSTTIEKLKKFNAKNKQEEKIFIVFQKKFNACSQFLINNKDSLGKIQHFSININWWRDIEYYRDWHRDEQNSGGLLFTQAIHAIELLSNVTSININESYGYKSQSRLGLNVPDIFSAVVKLDNNVFGTINVNLAMFDQNIEESLTIQGEKGVIKVGGVGLNELVYTRIKGIEYSPTTNVETQNNDYFGLGHAELINTLNNKILGIPDDKIEQLITPMSLIPITNFIETIYASAQRI
jgi:predicted dehydrogenase